jgi:hypothetical protein
MTGRRLAIGSPPRVLDACLERPAGAARAGAVVCHPHPEYGGDMENAVVVAVARHLVRAGIAALRFDFGPFSGGGEEVNDARRALEALAADLPAGAPLALVGYSFGAWVALGAARQLDAVARVVAVGPPLAYLDWTFLDALEQPVTFIVGERDQFCGRARLASVPERIGLRMLPGADHVLVGHEDEVGAIVAGELAALRPPPE